MKWLKWTALGCGGLGLLLVATVAAVLLGTSKGRALADGMARSLATEELNGAGLRTEETVLDYLARHPDRYALALWEVGAEDAGVFHDADRPWPLASTMKVLPMALASERLATGEWLAARAT